MTRAGQALTFTALTLALPLAGLALTTQPLVAAVPVGLALLYVGASYPVHATGLFLFAHVGTPIYVRPPVPVLSNVPYATAWMMTLIGLGVLAWLAGRPLPTPAGARGRRLAVALLLLPLAALVSLFDPATNGESFKMLAIAIVFPAMALLLVYGAARNTRDIQILQNAIMAGGCVASLYAVIEVVSGTNFFLDHFDIETVAGYYDRDFIFAMDATIVYRAFSVFLNPIEFGAVMAMIFPLAVIRMVTARDRREGLVFAAVAATLAVGVLLSVSRGPILSLCVVSVALGLIYRKLRAWLVAGAVLAALGVAVAWPFIGERVSARVGDSDNVTLRLKLFQVAIATFLDHPLKGVGIGNFPAYYLDTIRDHHIGPFYEFGQDRVEKVRVAENAYLQLAAEMGLVGLAAAAAAVAALLRSVIRIATQGHDERTRDAAIATGLMALVYGANAATVTAYTLYGPTMLMIGIVPAFALVLERQDALRLHASASPI